MPGLLRASASEWLQIHFGSRKHVTSTLTQEVRDYGHILHMAACRRPSDEGMNGTQYREPEIARSSQAHGLRPP